MQNHKLGGDGGVVEKASFGEGEGSGTEVCK